MDNSMKLPRQLPRALRPFEVGQYRLLAVVPGVLAAQLRHLARGLRLAGHRTGRQPERTVRWWLWAPAWGWCCRCWSAGWWPTGSRSGSSCLVVELVRGVGFGVAAVLALTDSIQIWQLAVIAFVLGIADGFFYPAYSAWLPALIDADELLAANGIEGVLRPTLMQAAGPALASVIIAVWSPGVAFAVVALVQIGAAVSLLAMRTTPVRREVDRSRHPLVSAVIDVREGFRYMVRTRWLLATLLFAILLVLVIMGPIEVLLPFAVKDQTGGGAGAFAVALAAFGIGGATRFAVRRVAAHSAPLPDADDPGLGSRMHPDLDHRLDQPVVDHGGRAVRVAGSCSPGRRCSGEPCCSGGCRRPCSAGCPAWTSSSRWP